MPTQEEIALQEELLQIQRQKLSIYLTQRDAVKKTGHEVPVDIHTGIVETRKNIRSIKAVLVQWGVHVEDSSEDEDRATTGAMHSFWLSIKQVFAPMWVWATILVGSILVATVVVLFLLGYSLDTLLPFRRTVSHMPSIYPRIVVADFAYRGSEGNDTQSMAHQDTPADTLYTHLHAKIYADNLAVPIERMYVSVYDSTTVRSHARAYSTTLFVWGWYDDDTMDAKVDVLPQAHTVGAYAGLAEPERVDIYTGARTALPTEYATLCMVGIERYVVGEYAAALDYFTQAIETIETIPERHLNHAEDDAYAYLSTAHMYSGNVFFHNGDVQRAIEHYDAAIQYNSHNAYAYHNRGLAYAEIGEYNLAMLNYGWAIELMPHFAYAYNNRGILHTAEGSYDAAIADFNTAITLHLNDAFAYGHRSIVYAKQGEYNRAIAGFTYALKLDPDNMDMVYFRGIAYALMGNYDEAMADFSYAIDYAIDHAPDADDARLYIGRGNVSFWQDRLDLAVADYDRAIERDPNSSVAYYNRGVAFAYAGNQSQAIVDFQYALELGDIGDNGEVQELAMQELQRLQ